MAVYNHLLFSELFFRQIRRNTDDLDNLRATLGTIRDTWQYYLPPPKNTAAHIWQPAAPIDKNDVHQLRSNFIEPVFGYLELVYGPCDADDRAFFLYGDWEQKNRTGLCLVLPYSAHIEGRDTVTNRIPKGRNYAQQLQKLLHAQDLEWGVLTNGRFWRLYHRSELSPTDTYLQVDLGNVISTEDIHDYIVFHRFFSRPAFVQENGRQRLDIYKEQSDKATQQIEDHLSTHVEEIVRYLSQGLVESCQANQEDITSRDTRTAIYQNALFLVYRLLFALYAEARDLLPLDNPTYADVCLRSLLQQVNHNHTNGLSYEDDYAMWDHLQALFALIDQGDADAEVPAYNGGLFDPGRRPFLTKHRIRNTFLQAALLRLAYLPAKGKTYDQDRRPLLIDYRDLSVRHLGSLYEGLLEYNLFVVRDEPRVVRATKKTTRYVPYSKAGKVRSTETVLQIGEVYFSETEGERKATGSYYTPEDVVAYIVRNTVGEVLQDRQQRFLEDQAIQQQLKDLADTPADIPAYAQIQRALDEQFLRFVNRQILDLKVLDPAMGSGHFLVNVTHNIANFIVDFLNETDWENPGIDTDVAYWKRLVAERCIFGVDLNELAVELAKLCLWMTTTAKGKPLTFVDHHLRRGNSLIGVWLKNVGIHPFIKKEDSQAFTIPLERFVVDLEEVLAFYKELYAKDPDDVTQVREKARLFDEEIQPRLQRYHELLSLHTSIYFGNHLTEDVYAKLGPAVKDKEQWNKLKANELHKHFGKTTPSHWLHWELDFVEAYSSLQQQPLKRGFDIILGNPPYANYPEDLSRQYLEEHFESVSSGDLYALFVERALRLAPPTKTSIGFIVPLSLTFSSRLSSLRTLFLAQNRHWEVYSFDKRPQAIFPNVQQRTSIIFAKPSTGSFEMSSGPLLRWRPEERKYLFQTLSAYPCAEPTLELGIPKLGSHIQGEVLNKLLKQSGKVSDHFAENELLDQLEDEEVENRTVYFFGVAYRWLTSAKTLPPKLSPEGLPVQLTGFSTLHFKDEDSAWAYMGILNSLVAFWFWLVYGDSFHVTKTLLSNLPIDIDKLSKPTLNLIITLGQDLQNEMAKHVFYNTMRGKVTANYNLLECRHITDKIDHALVQELDLGSTFLEDIKAFCNMATGE